MALMCTNLANDLGHHLVVTIIVTHGDFLSTLDHIHYASPVRVTMNQKKILHHDSNDTH